MMQASSLPLLSRFLILPTALVALAVFLIGDGAPPAHAQLSTVLVSNIGQEDSGSGFRTDTYSVAQAFTTGSASGGYTLGSIDIVVFATNITQAQRNSIRAELWSAATSGAPGSKLYDLTVPAHPISMGTVSFAAPANTTLSASTTYYAVFYTVGGFDIDLGNTTSNAEDSAATGWSIADGVRNVEVDEPTSTSMWGAEQTDSLNISVKGAQGQQAAPHPPANVLVYPSGDGSYLIVAWSAPDPENEPPVTDYDVEYKLSTATTWTDAGYDASQEPFGPPKPLSLYKVLSGLSIGSTYDTRVRAKNANGNSAWSTGQGTLSATTKDNNLSSLTLTASATTTGTFTEVELLSNFRPTQTDYFAVVADTFNYVKVTPTKRHTGASIKVNGTAVTSGSPSSAIAVSDGEEILIDVTAAFDSATTPWPDRRYTIELRRPANHPGGVGGL